MVQHRASRGALEKPYNLEVLPDYFSKEPNGWARWAVGSTCPISSAGRDDIAEEMQAWAAKGYQLMVHVNGDGATEVVLNAFEKVMAEIPPNLRSCIDWSTSPSRPWSRSNGPRSSIWASVTPYAMLDTGGTRSATLLTFLRTLFHPNPFNLFLPLTSVALLYSSNVTRYDDQDFAFSSSSWHMSSRIYNAVLSTVQGRATRGVFAENERSGCF